jgi:hypothetical protein
MAILYGPIRLQKNKTIRMRKNERSEPHVNHILTNLLKMVFSICGRLDLARHTNQIPEFFEFGLGQGFYESISSYFITVNVLDLN